LKSTGLSNRIAKSGYSPNQKKRPPVQMNSAVAFFDADDATTSSAGDARDDCDRCAIVNIGLKTIERPNVLPIHIDIDKPVQVAVPAAKFVADSGEPLFQLIENFVHGGPLYFQGLDAIRKPAQGPLNCHGLKHIHPR
jgi:hypothetical protein